MRCQFLTLTFAFAMAALAALLTTSPATAHAGIERPHHWLIDPDNMAVGIVLLGGIVAGVVYWARERASLKR